MRRFISVSFFAAILIGAFTYFYALTPYIGDGYDDSVYVGLSKDIAEGSGYVRGLVPGDPPASKYPPGWPMILSVVWFFSREFPENAIAFKAVTVLFSLGLAVTVFYWLRWRGETLVKSWAIALLTLFHPYIFKFGISVFSEIPFAFSVVAAVWLTERYLRLPDVSWHDAILPALAVAFSLYLRMFGLALVVSTLLFLLLHKKHREKGVYFGVLVLFLILPLLVYMFSQHQTVGDYGQELFLKRIEQPDLGRATLLDWVVRIIGNSHSVLLAGLPGMILPSQISLTHINLAESLRIGAPVPVLDGLLAILVVTSVLVPIILRRNSIDWFILFYIGMILVWPWEPTRFLVPLVPFWYLYVFSFFDKISLSGFLKNSKVRNVFQKITLSCFVLFITLNAIGQYKNGRDARSADMPEIWQARQRLFQWLEKNTAEDDVLGSMSDYQLYLYANRQSVRPFNDMSIIKEYGIDYIVLIPYGGVMTSVDLGRLQVERLFQADPELFDLVYADDVAGIEVFAVQNGDPFRD